MHVDFSFCFFYHIKAFFSLTEYMVPSAIKKWPKINHNCKKHLPCNIQVVTNSGITSVTTNISWQYHLPLFQSWHKIGYKCVKTK